MKIEFFQEDGSFGISTDAWSNQYEYVTIAGEPLFARLLQARGFLYGVDRRTADDVVSAMWHAAQAAMPDNYSDALRTGAVGTTLPVGTKLWLTLPPLPPGHAWGKATLAGTSVKAAWKQLEEYLLSGAAELAHTNPADLLEHVINTGLRSANGVGRVTQDVLGKALSGDLYFRVRWAKGAALPVAPNASGQTVLVQWVVSLDTLVDIRYRSALSAFDADVAHMADDLVFLAKMHRIMQALFDIGNLVIIRQGEWFGHYNELEWASRYCRDNVLLPALPGGDFGFRWSLGDDRPAKDLLDLRRSALDLYKTLGKAYAKYPALYVALVNRVCQAEIDVLTSLAVETTTSQAVQPEIQSALTWLGTASPGDSPPDDAHGLGVLLAMLLVPLPDGLSPPSVLVQLSMAVQILEGACALADGDSRQALEARIKSAFATTMALPKDLKKRLATPTGWDEVTNSLQSFAAAAKNIEKGAKGATRATEMPKAMGSAVARYTNLKLPAFEMNNALAVLRGVAFVATGIGLVDDAIKLGSSAANGGDSGAALEKLAKDSLSAYGTYLRDFARTRAQLGRMSGLLNADEAKAIEALGKRTEGFGAALGVVSGAWSFTSGLSSRNDTLTAAGIANVLGYGLRRFVGREAIVGLIGFDVTLPLLLVGAGLDLLDALGPAKTDRLVRQESVNMLAGAVKQLRDWYERHPPWRPETSSTFEEYLTNVENSVSNVNDPDSWTAMLPYSDEDCYRTRKRLVEIGFSDEQAKKMTPTEFTYITRGTPPTTLDPRYWPPNWPSFVRG